ncbi:periplasmic nitrate reductase chaperone NapD [Rhodovulum imhoffii]|uniref:Chaperone NapD n=1 Tax=Rhodovulum imhoffii TaxID=365340 RepID=A0A2T5BWD9_9RHOB|nr:chaperone NapD [Rhodovulum imhoffii]MBK5935069.1 nitrate reductase [Rhodovulum imhoffii]PTN03966.1 periplasmic nitrate reductase chaperone NapD [Rhodovulum imhoffii]
MNICGCLVHVVPEHAEAVRAAMLGTEGVEIHATDDDGRFVVVVEDTSGRCASETIMDLHQTPGVISLTLTYHHFEDLAETYPNPNAPSQDTSRRTTP